SLREQTNKQNLRMGAAVSEAKYECLLFEKDGKQELRTSSNSNKNSRDLLLLFDVIDAIFFSDLHKCRQSTCCKSSKQAGLGKLL
ncbi:hypothetical protein GW17_00005079, partial [Ensete ventricosum]